MKPPSLRRTVLISKKKYKLSMKKVGRVEGMIACQKHLIENIQKENTQLVQKLDLHP